jgi:4-hydroxy-tetrahydrodipicolinate reductase
MPLRLAVFGASGRLGQLITQKALTDKRFTLVAATVSAGSAWLGVALANASLAYSTDTNEVFDVAIDVSLPSALPNHLLRVRAGGGAYVCGVTGLDPPTQTLVDELSRSHAVLHTHNFSRGVTVMRFLAREAARLLGPDYDVGVIDIHHRMKRDAPSGTALSLEAALRAGGATEVQHSALRIGHVVGEHQVHFAGVSESLQITHSASDRAMFAEGALDTAAWLADKAAGRYQIDQVFGVSKT